MQTSDQDHYTVFKSVQTNESQGGFGCALFKESSRDAANSSEKDAENVEKLASQVVYGEQAEDVGWDFNQAHLLFKGEGFERLFGKDIGVNS